MDVQICNAQTIFTNGKNKENAYINSNIQIFKLSIKPKIENLYFTQVRKSLSLNRFMIIILFILSIASVDREDDGTGYPIGRPRDRGFSVIWTLSGKKGEVTKSGNTCWTRCAYGHMKENSHWISYSFNKFLLFWKIKAKRSTWLTFESEGR